MIPILKIFFYFIALSSPIMKSMLDPKHVISLLPPFGSNLNTFSCGSQITLPKILFFSKIFWKDGGST
jgi:hypothetical protein